MTRLGSSKPRTHNGAEKSVRLAVNMLVKVLLQVSEGRGGRRGSAAAWRFELVGWNSAPTVPGIC